MLAHVITTCTQVFLMLYTDIGGLQPFINLCLGKPPVELSGDIDKQMIKFYIGYKSVDRSEKTL